MAQYAHILLLGALLSGCTSVQIAKKPTEDGAGETETHRYFGFVEVVVPKPKYNIEAFKIQAAGIALENGLSIGWREREQVLVPLRVNKDGSTPDEAPCGLVVIIRSTQEAKHAAKMLQGLVGEEICKVNFGEDGD